MTAAVPTIELNDGRRIPQLGFGVFQIPAPETEAIVSTALAAGYRHVDTAAAYGNEAAVGRAVRAAHEPVYVTTKYFNPGDDHGRRDARDAFAASVDRLGLDHVDLYLVHWPVRAGEGFVESWRGLTELRDHPAARSIGVSNFSVSQLARIIDETGVTPAVNQVELHPYLQQATLRAEHARRGIATEAWGPLGQGERHAARVLADPILAEIAAAHGVSAAQVVIRWHLQIATIVIPKSARPDRLRENLDVLGFALTDEEMRAIGALDRDGRNGPDPDVHDFPRAYRGQAHERT